VCRHLALEGGQVQRSICCRALSGTGCWIRMSPICRRPPGLKRVLGVAPAHPFDRFVDSAHPSAAALCSRYLTESIVVRSRACVQFSRAQCSPLTARRPHWLNSRPKANGRRSRSSVSVTGAGW